MIARPVRDERGVTLIMVVVAIMFIGITFGALLTFQTTAMNSQSVFETKRSRDLSADAAIDVAIAQFQADHAKTCGTDETLLTYDPHGDNIAVQCTKVTTPSTAQRTFNLVAMFQGSGVANVSVTLYEPVGGVGASVVSLSSWSRS